MGVRRRDAGTPLTPGGSQQDHVDHNTCVLTTRTLQGAVLDLAVVPSDSKPRVVVSALENAVLPGGCALGSGGQRIAGVARRPVVVSISSGGRAGHGPSPDEVRGRGLPSRFSGLQDAPSARSTCASLRRSARTWTGLNNFEANTGDEVFFYDRLCRASLPQEHSDAAVTSMKSTEVWPGLAEWIRALETVARRSPGCSS